MTGGSGTPGLVKTDAKLIDAFTLEYPVFRDLRGFFVRVVDAALQSQVAGIPAGLWVQESHSRSTAGVLRGLHGRKALSEAKLVRCSYGAINDVIVDMRPWSETFGQWQAFRLDDVDHVQLYIPAGFAHGFCVMSDIADVQYRMDAYYAPELDYTIAFDDVDLAIEWPVANPIISERDRSGISFAEAHLQVTDWYGTTRP
jgi:dTDP-4-dehydrorhamnose 3,5-epimerase